MLRGPGSRARFALILLAALGLLVHPVPAASGSPELTGMVLAWVDGDTVRLWLGSRVVRVRLIGIDAPELEGPRLDEQAAQLGRPRQEVMQLAYAARAAAERLAPYGTRVRVETDVQTHDQFGRLLAYLWLPDGRLVNEVLLADGFALLLTVPPNVRYVDRFAAAQRRARAEGRGLWGRPRSATEPSPTPPAPRAPSPDVPAQTPRDRTPPQASSRTGCDPAYPTVCIPPPPPDLDCSEIPYRNFTVLPPDPHRFDRDRDGVGCET